MEQLAWLLGTVGFGAGLAGAMTGGLLLNRLGRMRALQLFLCGNALSILCYAWLASQAANWHLLQLACALEHFTSGMATVALFAEMMYHCRPHYEATDYTLQASLLVLLTIIASSLSGFVAHALGYTAFFLLCAGLTLGGLLPLRHYLQRAGLAQHAALPVRA